MGASPRNFLRGGALPGSLITAALKNTLSVYLTTLEFGISWCSTESLPYVARVLTSMLLAMDGMDDFFVLCLMNSAPGAAFETAASHGVAL